MLHPYDLLINAHTGHTPLVLLINGSGAGAGALILFALLGFSLALRCGK